ncbi:disulfide isomerase/thiol-disulfide oxidase [Corynebacterium caspium DSM 44850]|nr:disulfide isomerase/thiol-disulfide oxidase [Corynebacterium caspium DSM 44850]
MVIIATLAPLIGLAACAQPAEETAAPTTATLTSTPTPHKLAALAPGMPGDPGGPAYRARGNINAPVVVTEYMDLRCPFCAIHTNNYAPVLDPLVEAGQVRVDYRVVAVLGPDSERAAAAAVAAGEQGLFYDFVIEAMKRFPTEGKPKWSEAELVEVAKAINISELEPFIVTMQNPEVHAKVRAETIEARANGLEYVPTVLVNGQKLEDSSAQGLLAAVQAATNS